MQKLVVVFLGLLAFSNGKLLFPRLPDSLLLAKNFSFVDSSFIVGGTQAYDGQFPYQVSLQVITLTGGSHFCGASVISKNVVLTAAHCAVAYTANQVQAVGGDFKLNVNSGHEQAIALSSYTVNSAYNANTYANDIAIAKLKSSFTYGTYVQAVSLQPQGNEVATGTKCTVSGWGTTYYGVLAPVSNVLLYAVVPTVSDATCRSSYGTSAITDSMLCAGYAQGGTDACQGDSGGPLVDNATGRQVGVVSWGNGCAEPKYYGVYTEVSYFRNWISNNAGV